MNELQTIENKFAFVYPDLYKRFYQDGFLNWFTPHPNWYAEVYPTIKNKPPFLLYAEEFEIIPSERVIKEMESFIDLQDYRRIDPKYKLVPFATNGAGDLYSFLYNEDFKTETPVVLFAHDDLTLTILANNLDDFMFTMLLEAVVDINEDSLVLDTNFKENILNMLGTHKNYLSKESYETISKIYNRELVSYTYTINLKNGKQNQGKALGLLTYDELEQLVQLHIPIKQLNRTIDCALPEPIVTITEDNKRRVGIVSIHIKPVPPVGDGIYEVLKTLNWRQKKTDGKDEIVYYRNSSVLFGIPSMQTVDNTFRAKLATLKSNYPQVTICFQENDVEKVHQL
jgi:SMI1 / KNR4 family (SUKH-1)